MILHSLPLHFSKRRLNHVWLPRHARIPLGLADGSALHVLQWSSPVSEASSPRSGATATWIVTPFPVEKWSSIWNLDIQIRNVAGNLNTLLRFIRQNGASVLFYISRPALRSEYQICSFTIHLPEGAQDRHTPENVVPWSLRRLEAELRVHFARDLRFSEGRPKLAMRRNIVHFDLSSVARDKKSSNELWSGQLVKGCLTLRTDAKPSVVFSAPAGHARDTHYYAITTNAKSRVLYIDFFETGSIAHRHGVLIVDSGHVCDVVEALSDCGNILRSQIKPGLPWSPARSEAESPPTEVVDPMTINILYVDPLTRPVFDALLAKPGMKELYAANLLDNWLPDIRDPDLEMRFGSVSDTADEEFERIC
jgi:hypothetical protein